MQGDMNLKTKGFTLFELSILLIIIGLVLGGVLVGRDMIHAAELRRVVTDMDKYIAAMNAFRLKYNCIPGDCPNATDFFPGTSNGDGDGVIRFHTGGVPGGSEGVNIWNQLGEAELTSGRYSTSGNVGTPLIPGVNGPTSSMGANSFFVIKDPLPGFAEVNIFSWTQTYMAASTRPTDTSWLMLISTDSVDPRYDAPVLTSFDAKSIDDKIDDGFPMKGKIGAPGIPWLPDGCADGWTEAAQYSNLSSGRPACILMQKVL